MDTKAIGRKGLGLCFLSSLWPSLGHFPSVVPQERKGDAPFLGITHLDGAPTPTGSGILMLQFFVFIHSVTSPGNKLGVETKCSKAFMYIRVLSMYVLTDLNLTSSYGKFKTYTQNRECDIKPQFSPHGPITLL